MSLVKTFFAYGGLPGSIIAISFLSSFYLNNAPSAQVALTNTKLAGTLQAYSSPETGPIAVYKDPVSGKFSVYAQRYKGITKTEFLGQAFRAGAHMPFSAPFVAEHSSPCPEKAQDYFMCAHGMWDRLSDEQASAIMDTVLTFYPKTKDAIRYDSAKGYEVKAQIPAVYYLSHNNDSIFMDFVGVSALRHTSYFVAGDDTWKNNLVHYPAGLQMNRAFFQEAHKGLKPN